MGYFAELDGADMVKRVIVARDASTCASVAGIGNWAETKNPYDDSDKRGLNYAGIGHKFEAVMDGGKGAFVAPKPYGSWTLDAQKAQYVAPKEMPKDGKMYRWDEAKIDWVQVL